MYSVSNAALDLPSPVPSLMIAAVSPTVSVQKAFAASRTNRSSRCSGRAPSSGKLHNHRGDCGDHLNVTDLCVHVFRGNRCQFVVVMSSGVSAPFCAQKTPGKVEKFSTACNMYSDLRSCGSGQREYCCIRLSKWSNPEGQVSRVFGNGAVIA